MKINQEDIIFRPIYCSRGGRRQISDVYLNDKFLFVHEIVFPNAYGENGTLYRALMKQKDDREPEEFFYMGEDFIKEDAYEVASKYDGKVIENPYVYGEYTVAVKSLEMAIKYYEKRMMQISA